MNTTNQHFHHCQSVHNQWFTVGQLRTQPTYTYITVKVYTADGSQSVNYEHNQPILTSLSKCTRPTVLSTGSMTHKSRGSCCCSERRRPLMPWVEDEELLPVLSRRFTHSEIGNTRPLLSTTSTCQNNNQQGYPPQSAQSKWKHKKGDIQGSKSRQNLTINFFFPPQIQKQGWKERLKRQNKAFINKSSNHFMPPRRTGLAVTSYLYSGFINLTIPQCLFMFKNCFHRK